MHGPRWRVFYGAEAENYERARYGSKYGQAFRSAHRAVTAQLLAERTVRGAALDVASGTGQLIPCLMDRSNFLVATDLTPEMMGVSRRIHGPQVCYVQADAMKLPFSDACFDIVASSRFLHLFPPAEQLQIVREMVRVAKPGGIVLVDIYNALPRRLLAKFINIYRRMKRKRAERDYHCSPAEAKAMLEIAGLKELAGRGAGSYFAAPLLWLPQSYLSRLLKSTVLANKLLAEQWVLAGRRD